ncbi:uncharacterized protein LOC141697186 [Apium graveolens]|uniref:uncharacterized protein LOC141697186 n=1 Tax=Apium graveolens TaxID=4045 RepID=UPI003D79C9BF
MQNQLEMRFMNLRQEDVICFKYNQEGHYSTKCPSEAGKPELTSFKYRKVGHMVRNCKEPVQKENVLRIPGPSPSAAPETQPRARTFNMTMKDAVQNADVVAGMLDINLVEVKVLMDSGASRSFIAESVIARLNCDAYPLEPNLIREVANQERVTAKRICPICDRIIEGMDWFSNHYVQIECRSKRVKLETRDAHVKDVEKESLRIDDIPVGKDFPDVLPDELPGLPLDQELEFTIDLAPGTESISKAPYRMVLVEIKELAT